MFQRLFFTLCTLLGCATQAHSQSDWRYGLPETGLTPDSFNYELSTRAQSRDGESSFGWQTWGISAPLSEPTKSGYQKWLLAIELDVNISYLNTAGCLQLSEDSLYALDLPIALVRAYESGNRLTLALSPSLASDMGHTDGAFSVGAMVNYRVAYSKSFSYSFGAAYSPRYSRNGFVPMIGFDWDFAPDWTLSLSRLGLKLDYSQSPQLKWGPFLGFTSQAWTIHTEEEGRQWLRTEALTTGLQAEYCLDPDQAKRKCLQMALGMTIYSNVKTQYRNWSQNRDFYEYYKPSFYLSAGFDLKF